MYLPRLCPQPSLGPYRKTTPAFLSPPQTRFDFIEMNSIASDCIHNKIGKKNTLKILWIKQHQIASNADSIFMICSLKSYTPLPKSSHPVLLVSYAGGTSIMSFAAVATTLVCVAGQIRAGKAAQVGVREGVNRSCRRWGRVDGSKP